MESAIEVQVIASTHSPMVLTSVETLFDEARDQLIVLERSGAVVQVNALPFAKAGDVSSWLDSEVFGGQVPCLSDFDRFTLVPSAGNGPGSPRHEPPCLQRSQPLVDEKSYAPTNQNH